MAVENQSETLASYTRILSAATSPEGVAVLKADIDIAAKTVASIREIFKQIGALIGASNAENKDDLKSFWTEIDNGYFTAIQLSRGLASSLAGHATTFSTRLENVTGDSLELSMRRTLVDNFISNAGDIKPTVTDINKKLSDTHMFIEVVDDVLEYVTIHDKQAVEAKIDTVLTDITKLGEEIDRIDAEIAKVADKSNSGDIVTGVVGGILPGFCAATIINGCENPAFKAELKALQEERDAKIKQVREKLDSIDGVQKTLDPLAEIHARCHQLLTTYQAGITESTKAFEAIHKGILDEAEQVKKWLDLEEPTAENAPAVVQAYLKTKTSVFTVIGEALDSYNRIAVTG